MWADMLLAYLAKICRIFDLFRVFESDFFSHLLLLDVAIGVRCFTLADGGQGVLTYLTMLDTIGFGFQIWASD